VIVNRSIVGPGRRPSGSEILTTPSVGTEV
jgi:hypothetical protein